MPHCSLTLDPAMPLIATFSDRRPVSLKYCLQL